MGGIVKEMKETRYEMPDGEIIHVRDSTFKFGEILFDPKLYKELHGNSLGWDMMTIDGISKRDKDLEKICLVMCYGWTHNIWLPERLDEEIRHWIISQHLVDGYLRQCAGGLDTVNSDILDIQSDYYGVRDRIGMYQGIAKIDDIEMGASATRQYSTWLIVTAVSCWQ